MTRAERIRILKELLADNPIHFVDYDRQALTDSIAEAEMMEKVAEGMPKKTKPNNGFTYATGFNEAIDLCQANLVSRVGEIEKYKKALLEIVNYDSFGTCFETKQRMVKELQEIAAQALTTKLGVKMKPNKGKKFTGYIRNDLIWNRYALLSHFFKEIPFPKKKWKDRFTKVSVEIQEIPVVKKRS